jgi:flagellar M-ring protein FliF
MEQLKKLYESLSGGQRLAIISAIALSLATLGFIRWSASANFKPLYTSLSQEDAGAVIQKLKESGVEYRLVDGGSTILVPDTNVAESRLEMAVAGLPKTGRIGFEIFDRTNLGVTEFAEHINYQRALEGELERSVMSLTEVEQARVHVTFPKTSVFSESREPAKASVLLKIRPGTQLADRNVLAISHLLAAAVEGLDPRAVSILDMNGNLLSRARGTSMGDLEQVSDSMVDYRQALERNLTSKIRETLQPLLGESGFRAGVSVDCDFTSGERSEESYDPEKSVVLSSHVTEEGQGPGSAPSGGIPGTASALPRPRADGATTSAGNFRRSENVSYQTSRTIQKTKIPQGTVRKISAAVLVDYAVRVEGEGDQQKRVLAPPGPEKMEAIRELVAGAIGLDTTRGDQLTVQTLPFESTLTLQLENPTFAPSPTPGSDVELQGLERYQQMFKQNPLVFIGVGLAICAVLGLAAWILLRARQQKVRVEEADRKALAAAAEMRAGGNLIEGRAGTGLPAGMQGSGDVIASLLAASENRPLTVAVREIVVKDAELSAGIVQGWLIRGEK